MNLFGLFKPSVKIRTLLLVVVPMLGLARTNDAGPAQRAPPWRYGRLCLSHGKRSLMRYELTRTTFDVANLSLAS
jgi:hypothetical protein